MAVPGVFIVSMCCCHVQCSAIVGGSPPNGATNYKANNLTLNIGDCVSLMTWRPDNAVSHICRESHPHTCKRAQDTCTCRQEEDIIPDIN